MMASPSSSRDTTSPPTATLDSSETSCSAMVVRKRIPVNYRKSVAGTRETRDSRNYISFRARQEPFRHCCAAQIEPSISLWKHESDREGDDYALAYFSGPLSNAAGTRPL